MSPSLAEVAAAARAALDGEGDLHEWNESAGGEDRPRFELFHAAASICSQKVRAVLAHHRLPYVAHALDLFAGDTYRPEYVRLRMLGCDRHGGALASHHGGSTSVASTGCDGVVVPTLLDWQTGEVLVDSRRICLFLDEQVNKRRRLRPAMLADAIDAEIAVVDDLPNYQMLMGRTLTGGEPAETRRALAAAFSARKVAWCDRYLAEHPDEPRLVAAYAAKRAKEQSAVDDLFGAEAMQVAYDRAEAAVVALDGKLGASGGIWLFGATPSMADLFWGIELLRMRAVGAARFWEGKLPEVERYFRAVEALPAIRTAVIDWPGAS